MSTEIQTIPRMRDVTYDAYANFPASGNSTGDLAYATDRLVFYRWSGAAWQSVTIHSSSGAAAAIPTAGDLPNGSLFQETDTGLVKQVQAGAWVAIASGSVVTEGLYTGSGAANRAIPHGLGVRPKMVLIVRQASVWFYRIFGQHAYIHWQRADDVSGGLAVTQANATNFYVGNAANYPNSANANLDTLVWVAIA